jgi:hypothetical protein
VEVGFYPGTRGWLTAVVYDEGYEKLFDQFPELPKDIVKLVDGLLISHQKNYELFGKVLTNLAYAASILKHTGFREEREVRIVFFVNYDSEMSLVRPKPVKARGERGQIKYIILFDRNEERLPIKRIIVGPHTDQKGLVAKVRAVTGNSVDVYASATPYVQPGS